MEEITAEELSAQPAESVKEAEENIPDENVPDAKAAENAAKNESSDKKCKKKRPDAKASESLKKNAAASQRSVAHIFAALAVFLSGIGRAALRAGHNIIAAALRGVKIAAVSARASVKYNLSLILPAVFEFLADVGGCAWDVLSSVTITVFKAVYSFLAAVFGRIFGWFAKKLKQPLYDVWCFILTPFAHAYGEAVNCASDFKKACKRGFLPAIGSVFAALWKLLCGVGAVLRFSFNYIAPAVSVFFLISLVRYSTTLQYAISLEYNGNQIATIESEAAYNEAQTLIQDKITFTEEDEHILSTPKFTVTVMNMQNSQEQPVSDIDELSEMMIKTGDVPIVYAYGFYLNGELIGVYSEEDMEVIRSALDSRLEYYTEPDSVNVYFEDDISISEGRFIESVLVKPDSALDLINGSTEVEAYYVVKKGDTVSGICSNLGITREEFDSDNPGLSGGIRSGDIVTYHYREPHLNVLSTHYENYGQVIKRTVQYEYTSTREQYCEVLRQHGSDGYENVTALVTSTNGKESERVIVSRTVTEAMVPMIIRTGTKENTYIGDDTDILDTLGTFIWPVGDENCYISSDFGYRSWDNSNHRAIDIAGIPRGTDIYAACDGRVTFSGSSGAYGKLVIIDHGSGYETYYGHCNELLVNVGDVVKKGDLIAKVGMTGNASGNHLHFEVRKNNVRINPLIALGGAGGHRYNFA